MYCPGVGSLLITRVLVMAFLQIDRLDPFPNVDLTLSVRPFDQEQSAAFAEENRPRKVAGAIMLAEIGDERCQGLNELVGIDVFDRPGFRPGQMLFRGHDCSLPLCQPKPTGKRNVGSMLHHKWYWWAASTRRLSAG